MKRALVISSLGTMDLASITLMGLSSKREDKEKIGMFGTGLKYSIAKLLRDNIRFKVWNGDHELNITTRAGNFRGHDYQQLVVDGDTTSITTDMGPQWETWWIVRELLANARDEQAHEFYVTKWDEVEFKEGWTTFALDYDTFEQVWLSKEKYFVTDRVPKWENERLKLLTRFGQGTRIYKNGILVKEVEEEDVFDYDVADVELNEMREVRYSSLLQHEITEMLLRGVNDEHIVTHYLHGMNTHLRYLKDVFTGELSMFTSSNLTVSDTWKHVLDNLSQPVHTNAGLSGNAADLPTDGLVLPSGLYNVARRHIDMKKPAIIAEPNAEQREVLDRVLQAMFAVNIRIVHPVRVTELGASVFGRAQDGTILLDPKAFGSDTQLTMTLLEETIHLLSGASDFTRGFQNATFEYWSEAILSKR